MIQAGIYLRGLQFITEDEPIYEEKDELTLRDYRTQSHALYSYLCNEDLLTHEFVFAQNCIKSASTTMDGFHALKIMLAVVHPVLNNQQPLNTPPVYSDSGDLHLYE